jgi:type III pantothenate kinase
MTNLCIDIGNSLIKLATFSKSEMLNFEVISKNNFEDILKLINDRNIDHVIVSSVAEEPENIYENIREKVHVFINLNHETKIPVENLYETAETLGKDRIAAVIGAAFLYPSTDILVIDSGSAITYDFINGNGQYLGGNIAPGIQMRYKALHTFTRRLPLLEPSTVIPPFGRNTTDAILSGVQMGIVREADGTIDYFKENYPELITVLTGGDVIFFDNKLKNAIFVVPNLVAVGLNRILTFNICGA